VRLGFVEGPVAPPKARVETSPAPDSSRPAPSSVVAAAAAIGDAALRARFLESAARYLDRFGRGDAAPSSAPQEKPDA
jgi:hypothetical protein